MPRGRNPKMKKYHELLMEEWRNAKARKEKGTMSAETFKKNFRGCCAIQTGKAYANIQKKYHAWLKENGYPLPKPKPPRKKRKRDAKKSSDTSSKKSKK